jgi:hypothetical protein
MLDVFLQAGYVKEKRAAASLEMSRLMMKLPQEELLKIASGEAECAPKEGSGGEEWLEKFRGSPLLDQAFQLAQEEIALDMQDLQERQQRKEEDVTRGDHWMAKDQIGLRKRLLELQLVHGEVGGGGAPVPGGSTAAPEVGAQGAGAPGPEAMALEGGKTAAARADELVAFAVGLGREMAHEEFKKIGQVRLAKEAAPVGATLAKLAINWGGVGQMALGAVKKNPMAALGAGLGAVRGATQRDAQGNAHPITGALGGAVQGGFLGAGASKLVPGADAKVTELAQMAAPHLKNLGDKLRGAVSSMPTG